MRPSTSIVLAAIGIGSLALVIPLTSARAQVLQSSQNQRRATDIKVQDPGVMIAPMPPEEGWGPATMVADGDSLYILRGNRLFKVNKGDLRVIREGRLPANPPMEQRFEQGAPARAGRGGGGEKQ